MFKNIIKNDLDYTIVIMMPLIIGFILGLAKVN